MSLLASASGKDFENAPEGVAVTRCYRIIDLGTQTGEYMGKPKMAHKILVNWELLGTSNSEGKPFTIGKKYTLSLDEKANLRKDLEAWRGRKFTPAELEGFDISKLIGAPCMINIIHATKDNKTYANIASIMPLAGGMVAPQLTYPKMLFSLSSFDQSVFDGLSDGLKKMIVTSPEYAEVSGTAPAAPAGTSAAPDLDNDIPF
jgi:hypothetical protein